MSAFSAGPPVELVEAAPRSTADTRCPEQYRDGIAVVTLHDGDRVPPGLIASPRIAPLAQDGQLAAAVDRVRDWGADRVAHHLASALGIEGHHRVRISRAVVDFNRFPGVTRHGADHLDKLALGGPVAEALDDDERRAVLAQCYDPISAAMERVIDGRLIIISIHTYDERNATDTQRPEVSLLTRSDSYQRHSRLPFGLFDPLFPDVLAESSAKRVLRDRIALTIEKAGVSLEHNYPYCLPDGSLEIRSQPWLFFHRLRHSFESDNPETLDDPVFDLVWEMLFNTNLRRADAGALSRYLHRYCAAPTGSEALFDVAGQAYGRISGYLEQRPHIVSDYRRSFDRTSAITLEIRKDIVWRFDDGFPAGPDEDSARHLGRLLAESIATFLRSDMPPV